jgi:two-component system sensor histidine kinase DegS
MAVRNNWLKNLNKILTPVKTYHFWVIAAMFVVVIIFHYPQQLHINFLVSLTSSSIWLTRHALERVFLLVPITYASIVFGLRGGITALVISFFIMMPRALFVSEYKADAIFESLGVIAVGIFIAIWFHRYNKNISQRKRFEEMLAEIINNYPIPTLVIDKEHTVTHWNIALESQSGISKQEVIGTKDGWKAFYKYKRGILADFIVDGADESEIQAMYKNSAYRSPLIEGAYEAIFFFPDQGIKGKWFHFTASLIKSSNGGVIGAVETLSDITERKNSEDNLKFYLKEITKAQEEERKRIARELHDDTAQNLIALLHQLENLLNDKNDLSLKEAQTLWSFYERIRDILQEVRQFSRDLRPSVLDDLGLLPALEYITEDIKSNYWIDVSLIVTGNERRLSPETELLLFRIAQEALRNVAKHAKASKAEVKVEFEIDKVRISIIDDGTGFEVPDNLGSLPQSGKLGLTGLRERSQLLGGTLKIKSELRKGTSVIVEAPV